MKFRHLAVFRKNILKERGDHVMKNAYLNAASHQGAHLASFLWMKFLYDNNSLNSCGSVRFLDVSKYNTLNKPEEIRRFKLRN